jgi:hypothetical protein
MRFRRQRFDLERELRENRPQPRPDFLASLASRVGEQGRSRAGVRRGGLALAFTTAIVVALASVGGIGQAASSVKVAFKTVAGTAAPLRAEQPKQAKVTPAQDQYRRVLLCHKGQVGHPLREIVVDVHAVPAHLAHGDTVGPCPS